MENETQSIPVTAVYLNRNRTDPVPPSIQAQISTAWLMNRITTNPSLRTLNETRPEYLDTECTRCRELPDVVVLTNGKIARLVPCRHMKCPACGFQPEALKTQPCIWNTMARPPQILDASNPQIYLQNGPVAPEDAAFLQRKGIEEIWGGANPIPSLWHDLRIVDAQKAAYTSKNEMIRERARRKIGGEGVDPKACRRRIIDFRTMFVVRPRRAEERRLKEIRDQARATDFVGALPRVASIELGDGEDCTICTMGFDQSHEPARLECGHVFGRECIFEWLATGAQTCPMCRRGLFSDLTAPV